MAYPAFFTSPQQYRVNWHSLDTRGHIAPNSQRIVADSDAHASAWATILGGYLSAQNTTITKRLGVHNPSVTHRTGTAYSVNVLAFNALSGTQRFHMRNAAIAPATGGGFFSQADFIGGITALFLGLVDATTGVAALAHVPKMADGGPLITTVPPPAVVKKSR